MKLSEKRLKILQLLFIISLLITIFCINSAYAKYYEEMNTNYQIGGIKMWSLEINEKDIYEKTDLREILQPMIIENEHMRNNIWVPGREGYFDIKINYTKVDMPFVATFTIEQTYTPMLKDFEMYGYSVRSGAESEGDDGAEPTEPEITEISVVKRTDSIDPIKFSVDFDPTTETDDQKVKIIRAHLRWNDAEGAVMSNAQDTDYRGKEGEVNKEDEEAKSNTLLEYTATLTLTQKQD